MGKRSSSTSDHTIPRGARIAGALQARVPNRYAFPVLGVALLASAGWIALSGYAFGA